MGTITRLIKCIGRFILGIICQYLHMNLIYNICFKNRYLGQEKYEELLNLLYDGAVLLIQHNQNSSGADLAKLFVEVLQKAKVKIRKDVLERLADLMSKIPTTAPERQVFLSSALGWSQNENPESKKFEGHPLLHQTLANVYWKGKQ